MSDDTIASSNSSDARRGICCAGSWIVDHVKTVNTWPLEETLANILAEDLGSGGSAYNLCLNLSRFGVDFPIHALGVVGDDDDGSRIRAHVESGGADTRLLISSDRAPTSYTDVINVKGTGRRTFFHQRGANAMLKPEHFPVSALDCRILSLGYLLLLDGLDAEDPEFGTAAARVLADCRAAGIRTAVDVVTAEPERFERVLLPALAHTDYLIINEVEAGYATGRSVRTDGVLDHAALQVAAETLLERSDAELVVLHAPETALAVARGSDPIWQPSLELPDGFIRGSAGAGDAFFAGMLFGLHEGWALQRSLAFAHGAAASCLRHPTCTEGVGTIDEIDRLCAQLR